MCRSGSDFFLRFSNGGSEREVQWSTVRWRYESSNMKNKTQEEVKAIHCLEKIKSHSLCDTLIIPLMLVLQSKLCVWGKKAIWNSKYTGGDAWIPTDILKVSSAQCKLFIQLHSLLATSKAREVTMPAVSSSTLLEEPSHPPSASPLEPQTLLLWWNSCVSAPCSRQNI